MTLFPHAESTLTRAAGKRIMIVAGEASGDLHGADLSRELKALDSRVKLCGIGGAKMAGAGVRLIYDIANLAVMGIIEVFTHLKDIRSAMHTLENRFQIERPDLLILIDYPGFNLELARRAKKYNIPILYYISPKIWAWREGRIESIKKYIDRMAVILPFEKKYYQGHEVDVEFVGNPLLDQVRTAMTPDDFKTRNHIDGDATVIGIMPGSRRQEIAKLMPLFLQSASKLSTEIKKCVFLLPLASTLTEEEIRKHGIWPDNLDIRIVRDARYEAMAACDAAMAASGTLTMELAILGVPMVVCYRISMVSYLLAKPFIKVKYASLVNLVAGKEVVPELLQFKATAANIYREMLHLIGSKEIRESMQKDLKKVCGLLGTPGASKRAAKLALEMLAAEKRADD